MTPILCSLLLYLAGCCLAQNPPSPPAAVPALKVVDAKLPRNLSALRPVTFPPLFRLDPRMGGRRGNPGLKLRITKKGLDYANSRGAQILNAEIRKVRIPDLRKSISGGYVEAKNMRITGFTPPAFSYDLRNNKLSWKANNGKISIKGDWKGKKKVLITIRGSGTFTASASGVSISVSASFRKNSQGLPQLYNVGCSARIGSLSVKIKGGIVGWVLNLFRRKIADKIKPSLQNEICKQAKRFLERDANAKLRTFPTDVTLGRSFKLDYRLMSNPAVLPAYIQTAHKAEIAYRGRFGTPFYPHTLQTGVGNGKMLYLFASDWVLNSFLHSAHKHGQLRYAVNERNHPSVAKYLRTSCSGICLGTLFPDVEQSYPNAKGEAVIQSLSDPIAVFSKGKATLSGRGKFDLYAVRRSPARRNRLLTGNFTVAADLKPRIIRGNRVGGEVEIKTLRFTKVESSIEDLSSPAAMNALLQLATPILEEMANKELRKGIPIPLTRGVSLRNLELKMLSRTLQLGTDVLYRG